MMLWLITELLFMGVQSGLGWLRHAVNRPTMVPDFDLLLVLLVGVFARRSRVSALLVLLACTRAVLVGTPLAASLGAFLAVGWGLAASRHLMFRNRLPGRVVTCFFGIALVRILLDAFAWLGRGVPWPATELWLVPTAVTTLWALLLLPLLCHLPPLSLHMERSRV